MSINVTTKATPSAANDRGAMIPQYDTDYDHQLASKYLIVGDRSATNNTQALFIDVDGTLSYVSTPDGLALQQSGGTGGRHTGCALDGAKSLFVYPLVQGDAAPLQRAYTFDWTSKTFTRVADPPVGGVLDDYCLVSIGGGKAILFVTPDATGSVRTFLYDSGAWTEKTGHAWANPDVAVLMSNGKILTIETAVSDTCFVYDPVGDTWTLVNGPGFNPSIVAGRLHSGKVVVGALVGGGTFSLFNPVDNTWDDRVGPGGGAGSLEFFIEYAPNQLITFNTDPASTPTLGANLYDVDASTWTTLASLVAFDQGGWRGANKFFGINTNGVDPTLEGQWEFTTTAALVRRITQSRWFTQIAWKTRHVRNDE